MNVIVAIAGADAAERTRRFTFLVVIVAAIYAGYVYIPGANAGYSTVNINDHRGIYNAAYIGAAIALLTSAFLSVIGFFFVRGSVQRDWELHVDGTVASSPVSRVSFLLGKWLSNLTVLSIVAAITFIAAIGMQEWHGEDRAFDVLSYVIPFALITIPAMAFVSAIAIVFDVFPWLRGIVGGLIYVMVIWAAMLIIPAQSQSHDLKHVSMVDPLGMTVIVSNLFADERAAFPHEKPKMDISIGGSPAPLGGFTRYTFSGVRWTLAIVGQRGLWVAASLLLLVAVAPFFDVFRRDSVHAQGGGRSLDVARIIPNLPGLRIIRAEFALLVNGTSFWWVIGAAALAVLTAVVPIKVASDFVLPIALIWPLERIATLGAREKVNDTLGILGSTLGFTWPNVVAQWAAGTLLCAAIASGYILRLFASATPSAALAILCIIAATVAVALAVGTFTGTSRAFQALFLVTWYMGPIQHLPGLDVARVAQQQAGAGITCALVAVALALVTATWQRRLALR